MQATDLILFSLIKLTCVHSWFFGAIRYKCVKKYAEKVSKYIPLAKEIKLLWKAKKVNIIPVIIGCLGTINSRLIKCFKRLPFQIKPEQLQVVVLQQSAAILQSLFAEHSWKTSTWRATSALLLPAGAGNQFICVICFFYLINCALTIIIIIIRRLTITNAVCNVSYPT